MKKISDFKNDRMDMKQMAAISGGAATSQSWTSSYASGECLDTCYNSCLDDYFNHPIQGRTLYRHSFQTQCDFIC